MFDVALQLLVFMFDFLERKYLDICEVSVGYK